MTPAPTAYEALAAFVVEVGSRILAEAEKEVEVDAEVAAAGGDRSG